MKSLAGYLLHPKIPTDQHGLRVADLGAGTGYVIAHIITALLIHDSIWVSEVAAGLPEASFDAVDISADQFPPNSFHPHNVKFWTHDCFKPFPDEYLGNFDIVNARFWLCIVNDDVADKLLDNFLTLLSKPQPYPRMCCGTSAPNRGLCTSRTGWLLTVVRTATQQRTRDSS
jgi:SAM-dependent methyltransferase